VRLTRHRSKAHRFTAFQLGVKLKNTDRPPRLGPESLRLVERCRPADSLNCYLLAPSADRG
jgi:hypothetical protein